MPHVCSVKLTLIAVVFMTLVSCSNPGIIEISPDTYLLTRTDKAGMFGNASRMKASVLQEAAEFAASRGKVAVTVLLRETPMRVGQYASIEYQFRLVNPDDPAAKMSGEPLMPEPEVGLESTDNINLDVTTDSDSDDTYTQLLKLEDLRQRGVLTQAEFDVEKRKILEKE